jgi:hypothetical protein
MRFLLCFAAIAALSQLGVAQCALQEHGARQAGPPVDNFTTAPVAIGFTFPFNGATYTDLFISDHGILALANGTNPTPTGGAATYTPGAAHLDALGADCIFAYWGDHSTQGFGTPSSSSAGIWVDNTSGQHCTVAWIDNEPYLGYAAGAFSASVTLFPSGEIRVRMDDRCNNTSSSFGAVETIVGVHTHNNPIPASGDLSQTMTTPNKTVFEEFVGPGPVGSNSPDPAFDVGDTTLTFTPLNPGWLVIATPLACGSNHVVGAGCAGLSLETTRPPMVGTDWTVGVTGVQAPAPLPVLMAFGASTPATPVGALFPTLFGPACETYVDGAFGLYSIGAPTAGAADLTLSLPSHVGLLGATLSAQAAAFDPGAPALALSNGVVVVVGY